MIGLDPALGVHSSHHCQYIVIVCPVGAYYPEGLNPVKIYEEVVSYTHLDTRGARSARRPLRRLEGSAAVDLRLQDPDVGQIAVVLGIVQAIAHRCV